MRKGKKNQFHCCEMSARLNKKQVTLSILFAITICMTSCGKEGTNDSNMVSESNQTDESVVNTLTDCSNDTKGQVTNGTITINIYGADFPIPVSETLDLSNNNSIDIYYDEEEGFIDHIDVGVSDDKKLYEYMAQIDEMPYKRTYVYNEGKLSGYVETGIYGYDSDVGLGEYTTKEYDSNNRLLKETDYYEDGTIIREHIYTEDDNDEVKIYNIDGTVKDKMTLDSYENVISESDAEGRQETVIDDKGRKIKRTWYRNDGSIEAYLEWKYNDDGSYVITDWEYLEDGTLEMYYETKYDADDNIIEEIEYNADGSVRN